MRNLIVRSPTRVDLAGGTLDLWPLYNFIGGAKTVNVAIDIYTQVELTECKNIELVSADLGVNRTYQNLEECLRDPDPRLHLLHVQLGFWQPKGGFRLQTSSQSPVGGGLGGSSSLTVSLMKAFDEWCQPGRSRFSSCAELVSAAHNIEAEVLNTPTGTQDYYPAASGGLNILTYSFSGIEQEILPIQNSDLEKHFMLVYTGKSHHSGINNFEVLTKAVHRDPVTRQALFDLKAIAETTAEHCKKGNYSALPGLFRQEFAARVRLAPSFSSPEINHLNEIALSSGAEALKICGAGGGGCVLIWVSPDNRERVGASCEKNGFKVLPAKPVAANA